MAKIKTYGACPALLSILVRYKWAHYELYNLQMRLLISNKLPQVGSLTTNSTIKSISLGYTKMAAKTLILAGIIVVLQSAAAKRFVVSSVHS